MSSLYIWEIKTLSKVSLANIFSHEVGSLFFFLMFSLAMQKLFNLMFSHLFHFLLYPLPYSRGVKLIFIRGHINLTVAFKGLNVLLRLYKCNYSLTKGKELGTAASRNKVLGQMKQGGGPDSACEPCVFYLCLRDISVKIGCLGYLTL